jgi:hypothetical protein
VEAVERVFGSLLDRKHRSLSQMKKTMKGVCQFGWKGKVKDWSEKKLAPKNQERKSLELHEQ